MSKTLKNVFQVFDRIKKEVPKYRDKIVPICGDCSVEELGISAEDRRTLVNEVNVLDKITLRRDKPVILIFTTFIRSDVRCR